MDDETLELTIDVLVAEVAGRIDDENLAPWNDRTLAIVHDALQPVMRALVSSWQPIETAPKDGTWVLVYHTAYEWAPGRWGPEEWAVCQWDGYDWIYNASDDRGDLAPGTFATHWMPLPTRPSATPEQ